MGKKKKQDTEKMQNIFITIKQVTMLVFVVPVRATKSSGF